MRRFRLVPVLRSDIMDIRHQKSAMCIIMLGGEDTTVVCNGSREPHTSHYPSRPVIKNNQQNTNTSHYPSRPVEKIFQAAMIYKVL